MAVLSSHRGHGIGHLLLQAVEQFAIAQGFQCMFLSTTPFLEQAIRLYEQFGFHRAHDVPHELFGTPLFSMVKRLEPADQAS
jgi:GNAT superfamily N-acetyltransferase